MSLHVVANVQSPLGPVRVSVTDEYHIYVGTEHQDGYLEYRGKSYYAGVHLYRQPDGSWSEVTEGEGAHRAHITRQPDYKSIHRYDTPTIYDAIVSACTAAATEYVAEHPEVLTEAQAKHLANEVARAQRAHDEASAICTEAASILAKAQDAYSIFLDQNA